MDKVYESHKSHVKETNVIKSSRTFTPLLKISIIDLFKFFINNIYEFNGKPT